MKVDHEIKLKAQREGRLKKTDFIADQLVLREMTRVYAAVALMGAAFALQMLASLNPGFVEHYYSRGMYPYIAAGLSLVNRWFGFSLAEALLIAFTLGALVWLVVQTRRLLRRQIGYRRWFLTSLIRLLLLVGVGVIAFLLLWGLNYQRQPLSVNLELEARAPLAYELEAISREIVAGVNRNYTEAGANRDWRSFSRLPYDRTQLAQLITEAYQHEPLLKELTRTQAARPKPVVLSRLMSVFGITGVYNPFTGEPNYNAEQPDFELPYTIAHELAHQRGFAQEDEASFIAFLVCLRSSDPYVRYSGYMHGLNVVRRFGQLLRSQSLSPERYQAVFDQLGPGPRADLAASAEFWGRHQGWLMDVGQNVNDRYLKANRVASGVVSYSGVDGLIIGYYLKYQNP